MSQTFVQHGVCATLAKRLAWHSPWKNWSSPENMDTLLSSFSKKKLFIIFTKNLNYCLINKQLLLTINYLQYWTTMVLYPSGTGFNFSLKMEDFFTWMHTNWSIALIQCSKIIMFLWISMLTYVAIKVTRRKNAFTRY